MLFSPCCCSQSQTPSQHTTWLFLATSFTPGHFSGFIYELLSENPCISLVFNTLKFSNCGFFRSSAAWLTPNTPQHLFTPLTRNVCVQLETFYLLLFPFPLLLSIVPSPLFFAVALFSMFVTFQLLVLSYSDTPHQQRLPACPSPA